MEGVTEEKRTVKLYQEEDSCQDTVKHGTGQKLTLTTRDAGGGKFLVIKTKRWAIDSSSIDDFAKILKDFMASADSPKENSTCS
jgi:hypothetical protein